MKTLLCISAHHMYHILKSARARGRERSAGQRSCGAVAKQKLHPNEGAHGPVHLGATRSSHRIASHRSPFCPVSILKKMQTNLGRKIAHYPRPPTMQREPRESSTQKKKLHNTWRENATNCTANESSVTQRRTALQLGTHPEVGCRVPALRQRQGAGAPRPGADGPRALFEIQIPFGRYAECITHFWLIGT